MDGIRICVSKIGTTNPIIGKYVLSILSIVIIYYAIRVWEWLKLSLSTLIGAQSIKHT